MLARLIYSSRATRGITTKDLISICKKAGARNLRDGITGVLAYCDQHFLQELEGERDAIWSTFQRILQDSRHEDCQLVCVEEIEQRSYPEWTMRHLEVQQLRDEDLKEVIKKHSGAECFTPWTMTTTQCEEFLQELHSVTLENECSESVNSPASLATNGVAAESA